MDIVAKKPQAIFIKEDDAYFSILYFHLNTTMLEHSSLAVLGKLKALLASQKNMHVLIDGFTSSDGNEIANLSLSTRRREAVIFQLSNNFSGVRFHGVALGESNAKESETASNSAELEYQRKQNRRVILTIFPEQTTSAVKGKKIEFFPKNLGKSSVPESLRRTPNRPDIFTSPTLPKAPSVLDNVENNLSSLGAVKFGKKVYHYATNLRVGPFKLDLVDSALMTYQLNAGTTPEQLMRKRSDEFIRKSDEQIKNIEDLKNPNRVY